MTQQLINVGTAPNDATGDTWRLAMQKANGNFTELYNTAGLVSSVVDFGADKTGVVDSTAAIQAAVTTGLSVYFPKGTYKVTNQINITTPNQRLYGEGIGSKIMVAATFNLAATGVFVAAGVGNPDHGVWFEELWFSCDQSVVATSGTRANLVLYPPCLYLRKTPRCRINRCRIDLFTYGVDIQDNTPGTVFDDLEMGCFTCGIAIDGSADTTRMHNVHFIWFNEWTNNQRTIISDGNTIGVSSGRCDGLNVLNSLFFTPNKGINTFLGTGNNQVQDPVTLQSLAGNGGVSWNTGFTTGLITGSGFDTYGGVSVNGNGVWLQVANCYFSSGVTAATQVTHTAGQLNMVGCRFSASGGPPNPMISTNNVGTVEAYFSMVGCQIQTNLDQTVVSIAGSKAIDVIIEGCEFQVIANTSPTNTLVVNNNTDLTRGLSFVGNRFTPKGTGTGTALSSNRDTNDIFYANEFSGWGVTLPGSPSTTTVTKTLVAANTPRGTLNLNNGNQQAFASVSGGTAVPVGTTTFLGPAIAETSGASQNSWAMPRAGNIIGFTATVDAVAGAGQSYTYTVVKNLSTTTMTGQIAGASQTSLVITTNPFSVAQNDAVCLQLVTSAASGVAHHKFSILYEPA